MRVSQVLQLRLKRSVPVSAALALPDMVRDRRIERMPRRSRVPLPWDLERYTATLAELEADAHFSQPPERPLALEGISALMENPAHACFGSSRAGERSFRTTADSWPAQPAV